MKIYGIRCGDKYIENAYSTFEEPALILMDEYVKFFITNRSYGFEREAHFMQTIIYLKNDIDSLINNHRIGGFASIVEIDFHSLTP